jgi:predicted AlkP superfamily phosphohydrolase/phosphomutase
LRRKLDDIDKSISFVADSIDDETLMVVIGDHGMTETGFKFTTMHNTIF